MRWDAKNAGIKRRKRGGRSAESARYVAPVIGRVVGVDKELEERNDGQRKLKSYVPFFQYIAKG